MAAAEGTFVAAAGTTFAAASVWLLILFWELALTFIYLQLNFDQIHIPGGVLRIHDAAVLRLSDATVLRLHDAAVLKFIEAIIDTVFLELGDVLSPSSLICQ